LPDNPLTPLQVRVLGLLASLEPRWTLTGGGALSGVHFGHRPTRDLDLFWHELGELGSISNNVVWALEREDLRTDRLEMSPTFARLRVSDGGESIVVDLVADRVPVIEQPIERDVAGTRILVDTPHEIFVNKLCTLLGRKELRDLRDVHELLRNGGDLERALADAPRKDGGFSPLVLAWILRGWSIADMAPVDALTSEERQELERFRDELVERLTRAAAPG
jgi:hypothetical protein